MVDDKVTTYSQQMRRLIQTVSPVISVFIVTEQQVIARSGGYYKLAGEAGWRHQNGGRRF